MFNFASLRRLYADASAFALALSMAIGLVVAIVAPRPAFAQLPGGQTDDASYREKLKALDNLNAQNRYLESLLADQENTAAALRDAARNLATLNDALVPHLFRLLDDLDAFVQSDLPFLPAERQQRLAALRQVLGSADTPVAEKYRLIIEAYQVEAGFGREVDTYAGWLDTGGTRREVSFLRVGRLVLAYQTRDGAETGIWNARSEPPGWQTVEARYAVEVARGLRMASRQAAPDWLTLPVAAPEAETRP